MNSPLIVSVVRDFAMYERCISANPFCEGCELRALDNRKKNESIPIVYNREIETCIHDAPRWLVFCHQDFEVEESLSAVLLQLDENVIYGPIGARYVWKHGWNVSVCACGDLLQSDADGSNAKRIGCQMDDVRVDTLDCVCLIVHSSLVRRCGLRFDENLSFDLYPEIRIPVTMRAAA